MSGCYANPSFSIFQKELSDEERHLFNEVLSKKLAHFEWLEKFKIGLGFEDCRWIISFSNNLYLIDSASGPAWMAAAVAKTISG